MSQPLFRWLPVVAWMALIFFVSSMPRLPMVAPPFWQELLSKGAHFSEYAVLAGLLWRALPPTLSVSWPYWLSWVIAALYAASDEFHQSFVPNRDASLEDVAFDVAGALAALVAIFLWRKLRAQGASQS